MSCMKASPGCGHRRPLRTIEGSHPDRNLDAEVVRHGRLCYPKQTVRLCAVWWCRCCKDHAGRLAGQRQSIFVLGDRKNMKIIKWTKKNNNPAHHPLFFLCTSFHRSCAHPLASLSRTRASTGPHFASMSVYYFGFNEEHVSLPRGWRPGATV